ncbi:MAG TPA: MBL fold metallo-hydrolase [Candidatus Woesebacteria bacterium]|nr:MBL fold metallo-hydrolase [Candidatus Woesebacteria bacterium]
MKIHRYPLGQMQANCYILEQEDSCLIIDPTDEAGFILEKILKKHLTLVGLIATHGHFDHIMAVGEIQLTLAAQGIDLPLYIHAKDTFLLKRVVETAKHFLNYEPAVIPIQSTKELSTGDLKIQHFEFQIIHTPGHTPGSCCFYFKNDNVLFTGDTLFKMGIGRYDFSYSDKDELKKSLKRIFTLPEDTIFYSGHGEESTLEDEKENATFMIDPF